MTDRERRIFSRVGELGTLADAEEVVRSLGKLLRQTLRARWAALYPYDRTGRAFLPPEGASVPEADRPLFQEVFGSPGALPLATVLKSRRPLAMTEKDLPVPAGDAGRKSLRSLSFVLVPMTVRTEVTGAVLIARSRRDGASLSEREIETVKAVASHAGLVLEHIRLFDVSLDLAVDLGRRIDVILSLDEINRAISSSLSRSEIMGTALENLARMTTAPVVALLQEEKGELTVTASRVDIPAAAEVLVPGTRPKLGKCSIRTAFRDGRNCSADLGRSRAAGTLEESLGEAGIAVLLAIPLTSRERITGVLVLGDADTEKFTPEVTFTAEKIAGQLAVALANARLYEDLKNLFFSTVASLANAIDAKSPWTKGHSERVMHLCGKIAREMGLPPDLVERIRIGGLLHDIGKIGIIENVLEKPDSLSASESPSMRLHPVKGVAILSPIEQLKDILPAILHHHERWDGKGYPDGLKGEEIPLSARIVTVADAFDAMIAVRPYKQGRPVEDALAELRACSGTQFDPAVVEAFLAYIGRHWKEKDVVAAGGSA